MHNADTLTGTQFRLRDVNVDLGVGVISGPGGTLHLEPRVIAVLRFFSTRPGELVSRSELLAEIWPGTDIYDEALTQCVYQLRQQLVSAGGDNSYKDLISTVPKRGYVLKEAPLPVEAFTETPREEAGVSSVRYYIGFAAVVILVGLAITFFRWDGDPGSADAPKPQVLAVLPFLPLTELHRDPELELGMADTLIARLSEINQIIVRPITSVRQYGQLDRNSLQLGSDLAADAILDGSIQRQGDQIRINARLLRVSDGVAIWTGTFDTQLSDIFSIQQNISSQIVVELSLPLGRREKEHLGRAGTSNVEAYQSYLSGRYHFSRLTPADLQIAVASFRQAVTLDPGYTDAWIGLANALFRSPLGGEVAPRDFFPEAKIAVQRALQLDKSRADAYAMLGEIAFWYEWDWAGSEALFKQAIQLAPNDMEGHLGFANLLASLGRIEQALVEVRRAREISPFYPMAAVLEGYWLMSSGRLDEAQKQLEAASEMDATFWHTLLGLSWIYTAQGHFEEALQEIKLARKYSSNASWAIVNEVEMLASMGRVEEAEALRQELLERAKVSYVPPFDLAAVANALGYPEDTLKWLLKAYEVRDPKMTFLAVYPFPSAIRNSRGFVDLLARMNLLEVR